MTTLDRRPREREKHHRALLLYAMQHPEKRSTRAVARALSVGESTVRGWRRRLHWDERSSGPESEESAVALYRRLYLPSHGPAELPEVADRVSVPMSAKPSNQPPPATFQDDITEADKIARREILRRQSNDRAVREKHLNLVDGAIGYVVKQLQEDKIRASLRDIPTLLNMREVLSGGDMPSDVGGVAIETVRVRTTRQAGGDVLEAMAEDLEEFRIIIDALKTRRDVTVEEAAEQAPKLKVVE